MSKFNDLLKQADKIDDITDLQHLYDNFINNKKSYSLSQIDYAMEHFVRLAKEMAKRHSEQIQEMVSRILKDN